MARFIDYHDLDDRGVAIAGREAYASVGYAISSAGDFNDDGLEDFVFSHALRGED